MASGPLPPESLSAASKGDEPSVPAPVASTANGTGARRGLSGKAWLALLVVCVAVFLTALDQTVVVTALTSMIGDLGVPLTQPDRAAWIVSGYLLGYVVAMPLMGRVGDVFGRRRVFALCLSIFAVGSLLCAAAPQLGGPIAPDFTTLSGAILTPFYNLIQALVGPVGRLGVDTTSPGLDVLVAARCIQAVGGGALVPVGMAVVADVVGVERRGLALGIVGAVTEAGGVLGPLYGAAITNTWGWTWIFTLNVPIAVVLLAAGLYALPKMRGPRERIDWLGALLFGASLTCLTIGLGQQNAQIGAPSAGGKVQVSTPLLLAAGTLFLLFVGLELWRRSPVVDLRLFRSRALSASSVLSLLIGAALIVALVEIPLYMATLLGATPIAAGLALLRLTALIPVGAVLGGLLSTRLGCPAAAASGVALTAVGLWLMHLWPANVGQDQITLATVVGGLGFGLVIAPVSTSALNGSPRAQAGVASAAITVLRMTGMTLGLAGLTAWGIAQFNTLIARQGTSDVAAVSAALHQVYSDIFAATALIALLGLIPALLLWRQRDGSDGDAGPTPAIERYVAPLG
jgi:MFS family permease